MSIDTSTHRHRWKFIVLFYDQHNIGFNTRARENKERREGRREEDYRATDGGGGLTGCGQRSNSIGGKVGGGGEQVARAWIATNSVGGKVGGGGEQVARGVWVATECG